MVLVPTEQINQWLLDSLDRTCFFSPADLMTCFAVSSPKNIDLPMSIEQLSAILDSECPFVAGKKIKDTHYLFYLPDSINGEPFTVRKWGDIIQVGGKPGFYGDCYPAGEVWYADCPFVTTDVARYSWYLMFKGVMPESEDEVWTQQMRMVPGNYEIPKLIEIMSMFFFGCKKKGPAF